MGAVLTGMLARNSANANLSHQPQGLTSRTALFQPLVFEQLKAIGVTLVLAIVGTIVIAYIVKALIGLRPGEETETIGLDLGNMGKKDTRHKHNNITISPRRRANQGGRRDALGDTVADTKTNNKRTILKHEHSKKRN